MTAITALKNSFQRSYEVDARDTISILGQKVSYHSDGTGKESSHFRYICTYSLLIIVLGCTETFGMAIYTELRSQLGVSTTTVAIIYSCKSIAFAIGAMVCAWALDQFTQTHRYISIIMVIQSAAVFIIPFTSNLLLAYVLFIVIGYSMGSVFVCFPVYIFRLYPRRKTKILFLYLLLSIYLPAKILTPLVIQFAISTFNAYDSPLFLISALSFLSGISMLSVLTPQHDDLRTIKDDIQKSNDRNQCDSNAPEPDKNGYHIYSGDHHEIHGATDSLGHISDDRTDPDHHSTHHGIDPNSNPNSNPNSIPNSIHNSIDPSLPQIDDEVPFEPPSRQSNAGSVLPQIMDSLHGVHQSEMYLESPTEIEDISNQISFLLRNDETHVKYQNIIIVMIALMYLLFSSTQSGLLNFITTFCEDYLDVDESNGRFMISCYYGGQLIYRLMIIVLIGTGKGGSWIQPNITLCSAFVCGAVMSLIFVLLQQDISMVYIVYSLSGIVSGGIIPDLYSWSESVRPLSGMVSFVHIIGFSGGDALSVFAIGELFDIVGPETLPVAVLIANIIGFAVAIAAVFLFSKYKLHRSEILGHYYNRA